MSITKYYNLIKFKMFPICRSITGGGIRKTLKIIKNEFPKLKIYSFKTGTKVFDWKIPYEWNIKKAYILDKNNPFYIVEFEKEDKTPTTTNATAPKKLTDMSSIELSIMKKNQPLDFKSAYDMLGANEKKMVDNKSAGK